MQRILGTSILIAYSFTLMAQVNPPVAPRKPHSITTHQHTRVDDYYWLNERENKEVIQYLEQENAYTASQLAPVAEFRERLFTEMVGRIKQTDLSVPYFIRGYYYYNRFDEGKEYPIYCRKKGNLDAPEEIMLDVNVWAAGKSYLDITGLTVSPNNQLLAFGVDEVSRRKYTLTILDLATGKLVGEQVANTDGSYVWANDNKTLFYDVKDDETLRTFQVKKHTLGTAATADQVVFEEKDETFGVSVYKTKSEQYIVIGSYSTLTSESRFIDANTPNDKFKVFEPRKRDVLYSVDHYKDHFYITTNVDGAFNFKLMKTPVAKTGKANWTEVIAHRQDVLLEDIDIYEKFLVVAERKGGLNHIRVKTWVGNTDYYLSFKEPVYDAYIIGSRDFNTEWLRFGYTSLVTPSSVMEQHMVTKEQRTLKVQEVLGGYNASEYTSERIMVKARDGVMVPVSLVYRKGFEKNGKAPLLLYGYGSYGASMDAYFSSVRLSLLDRGFVFAIAHIRGGQELGRQWYEDGKLLKKKNTFTDFIDCADYLVAQKYTSAAHLYAMGGSAGGLLMGAVINMRPELFKGVVAQVPFVDVVTTMLDESIPLTTGEFDEWGNPKDKPYYEYMLSYSPYDNVVAQNYPNLLVTTGLHDSQVQYWEPAKWVAKLRQLKTDQNVLLLYTEMEAGHGGKSGRFERLKEVAMEYAFLLYLEGITK